MSSALTASEAMLSYLDRMRDDGMTWKERLFQAYFKYAIEGNATYARIILNALNQKPPTEKETAAAAHVVETDEPQTFHSELRAFMMTKGRLFQFMEAITTHAVTGKAAFGRFIEILASVKPPTCREIKGNVLVVDDFNGKSVMPIGEYERHEQNEKDAIRYQEALQAQGASRPSRRSIEVDDDHIVPLCTSIDPNPVTAPVAAYVVPLCRSVDPVEANAALPVGFEERELGFLRTSSPRANPPPARADSLRPPQSHSQNLADY